MSVLSIVYGIFMNTNKQLPDCPARSPFCVLSYTIFCSSF
nr:MAG TPA: hypothetical protein [Bacteriophage sp.]